MCTMQDESEDGKLLVAVDLSELFDETYRMAQSTHLEIKPGTLGESATA